MSLCDLLISLHRLHPKVSGYCSPSVTDLFSVFFCTVCAGYTIPVRGYDCPKDSLSWPYDCMNLGLVFAVRETLDVGVQTLEEFQAVLPQRIFFPPGEIDSLGGHGS